MVTEDGRKKERRLTKNGTTIVEKVAREELKSEISKLQVQNMALRARVASLEGKLRGIGAAIEDHEK